MNYLINVIVNCHNEEKLINWAQKNRFKFRFKENDKLLQKKKWIKKLV